MKTRLRIVVGGFLGLIPSGGLTWHYIQYPVGFAALGCDVYYIEDTRVWPVYQADKARAGDCSASVQYLASAMDAFGLSDRWAYRDEASGRCYGLSEQRIKEICVSADMFVNVSCSTCMRDEYRDIPVRALIDTDPMFTQVQSETQVMFTPGTPALRELINAHTHHFTFGANIANSDCRIPTCGISWRPTRQPICLDHWPSDSCRLNGDASYTTVMNWTAAPPIDYAGEKWGQKNAQFREILKLPRLVPGVSLTVAVGQTTMNERFPEQVASEAGWEILDSRRVASDWRTYRRFIKESRGEVSVAKQTYVKACTGWFSERSACYLASGRPVITQDTGWTQHLPNGKGLLAFDDLAGCVEAIRKVEADYRGHAIAARHIAEEWFDSDAVLDEMLRLCGI